MRGRPRTIKRYVRKAGVVSPINGKSAVQGAEPTKRTGTTIMKECGKKVTRACVGFLVRPLVCRGRMVARMWSGRKRVSFALDVAANRGVSRVGCGRWRRLGGGGRSFLESDHVLLVEAYMKSVGGGWGGWSCLVCYWTCRRPWSLTLRSKITCTGPFRGGSTSDSDTTVAVLRLRNIIDVMRNDQNAGPGTGSSSTLSTAADRSRWWL